MTDRNTTKGARSRFLSPMGATLLLLLAVLGLALWMAYLPWKWERTKEEFRTRFPAVRRIAADGPESLMSWLAKREGTKPVVIDLRSREDYDHSHLPGALHMGRSDTPAVLGFAEAGNESFVLYDEVGADAFPVADSLTKRRYERVQVLEGGIFEWANRGLPLEGASGASGRVRAGDSKFAGLLKRRARAE